MRKLDNAKIANLSVLTALSMVLVLLVHFPIFPAAPYLEYDPADVPIIIAAFLYGPLVGIVMTILVSFLQGFTVSSASGVIGIAMHIISTGTYVLVAGSIYKKFHTRKGALAALIMGTLAWTLIMIPSNLIFTPMYGVPIDAVKSLLLPVIIPFNLIKGAINSTITFIIYKHLHKLFNCIEKKSY